MTTSEKLFNEFYNLQDADVKRGAKWDSIIDEEETWILNNCPELYTIEKASDQLQRFIRTKNIERHIIGSLLQKLGVPEKGLDARRIIFSNLDFVHDGSVGISNGRYGLQDKNYNKNINTLKTRIGEALVDNPLSNQIVHNKVFIVLLSLNFGDEEGGHFGVIFGELNTKAGNQTMKLGVVDPYSLYANAFIHIFNEAIEGLKNGYGLYDSKTGQYNYTDAQVPGSPFSNYKLEWNIITEEYLETVTNDNPGKEPKTDDEKYKIQNYWGQDHFCFMWFIMFIHRFFIAGKIDAIKTLYNEIQSSRDINLVIIKTYTIQLFRELGIKTAEVFNECFKCVWSCYTVKPEGPMPPEDQTRYKAPVPFPVFFAYQINYNPNNMLMNATVASLGLTGLTVASLPDITKWADLKCSNTDADKKVLISKIQPAIITEENINVTDSVFRILHYVIKSYSEYVSSDAIYQKYTSSGKIIKHGCLNSRKPGQDVNDTIKYMNLKPKMTDVNGVLCERFNKVIDIRNRDYEEQNKNMSCDLANQRRKLFDYQERAVRLMIQKSISPASSPGLLVWFGTGTGKTITASTIAKITTLCNQSYKRCFIISTKSVYKDFSKSLGNDTDLTPDALLPNPTNKNQSQDAVYFSRHTDTDSVQNLPVRLLPETDIYVFSSTRFMGIMKDKDTGLIKARFILMLNESLLIIDEAHKIINIDARMQGEYAFFHSCCMVSRQVMLMTATPMVNSPNDIEMLLALTDKRPLESKKDFKTNYVGAVQTTSNISDICPVEGLDLCNFNLIVSYTTQPANASSSQSKFGNNRIINAMPTGNLPDYVERRICISSADPSFITALRQRPSSELENMSTSISKSFGKNEINNPLYTAEKILSIIKIIRARENTDPSNNITYAQYSLNSPILTNGLKYKYVIYSQSTKFLKALESKLEGEIPSSEIDSITGDTSDRQGITKKYNTGKVRVLLITDAAMEGVDLRRTAMVILAEPVWTKAKYDQIKGRGVRNLSGLRLKDADYDVILKKIETFSPHDEDDDDVAILSTEPAVAATKRTSARTGTTPDVKLRKLTRLEAKRNIEVSNMKAKISNMKVQKTEAIYQLNIFRTSDNITKDTVKDWISKNKANPYSEILEDELDFSTVPKTVDCMTIILSYSDNIGGKTKYSIDTYKYNAMRVKNSEIGFFTEQMLRPYFA